MWMIPLFLAATLALAVDEEALLWLENPKDPDVIAMGEERTAAALDWIDQDGILDAIVALKEAWEDDQRITSMVSDHRAGVGVWTVYERIDPEKTDETDETDETRGKRAKKDGEEEAKVVFHSRLYVRKAGEPPPGVLLDLDVFA